MAILGFALDPRIRSMLVAPFAFVSLLSALGHKEWRFIIYVVPLINIAAARGARWMQVHVLLSTFALIDWFGKGHRVRRVSYSNTSSRSLYFS